MVDTEVVVETEVVTSVVVDVTVTVVVLGWSTATPGLFPAAAFATAG